MPQFSRNGSKHLVAAVTAVALLWAITRTTWAAEDEARRRFERGVAAARAERWEAARQEFKRALDESPRPIIRLNLAAAESHTGRLVEAAENYRLILAAPPSAALPLNGEERQTARALLAQLQTQIPTVAFKFEGDFSRVSFALDERMISGQQLMAPIAVNPGEHELRGLVLTDVVLVNRFAMVEGEHRAIALSASSLHFPPAPKALLGVNDAPRRDETPPPSTSRWVWGALATAAVAAVVTTIIVARSSSNGYEGNIPPGRVQIP